MLEGNIAPCGCAVLGMFIEGGRILPTTCLLLIMRWWPIFPVTLPEFEEGGEKVDEEQLDGVSLEPCWEIRELCRWISQGGELLGLANARVVYENLNGYTKTIWESQEGGDEPLLGWHWIPSLQVGLDKI